MHCNKTWNCLTPESVRLSQRKKHIQKHTHTNMSLFCHRFHIHTETNQFSFFSSSSLFSYPISSTAIPYDVICTVHWIWCKQNRHPSGEKKTDSRRQMVVNIPFEVCHHGCNTRIHPKFMIWCDSVMQSWTSMYKRMTPIFGIWQMRWHHKSKIKSVNSIGHTIHWTKWLWWLITQSISWWLWWKHHPFVVLLKIKASAPYKHLQLKQTNQRVLLS